MQRFCRTRVTKRKSEFKTYQISKDKIKTDSSIPTDNIDVTYFTNF